MICQQKIERDPKYKRLNLRKDRSYEMFKKDYQKYSTLYVRLAQ